MHYLSWLFFCLSPFALFCSEDGNGLILCPVFIILGFVFKWLENNSGGGQKAVVKIEPQKFWEWHYKNAMRNTLADKEVGRDLMSAKDQDARDWATTVCRYHNTWIPPEEKQEQIAREYGVITKKMIKEEEDEWDRLQAGKCYLLEKFKEENKSEFVGMPNIYLSKDIEALKFINGGGVSGFSTYCRFGKDAQVMWDAELTEDEKTKAQEWMKEYKSRFLKEFEKIRENRGEMETISVHYKQSAKQSEEFDRKYGFIK